MFLSKGKLLDESDLTLLRAYTLKVEDGVRNATFNKFHFAFPQAPHHENHFGSEDFPG
jgi:hypothetical protein